MAIKAPTPNDQSQTDKLELMWIERADCVYRIYLINNRPIASWYQGGDGDFEVPAKYADRVEQQIMAIPGFGPPYGDGRNGRIQIELAEMYADIRDRFGDVGLVRLGRIPRQDYYDNNNWMEVRLDDAKWGVGHNW